MTKHTPGPWHIAEYGMNKDGTPKHYGIVHGDITIANLGTSTNKNAKEMDANARLIAAAPDLLEALLDMWNLINVDVSTDTIKAGTTFKTARAAIAKATGK